jgi:hypothetical protein
VWKGCLVCDLEDFNFFDFEIPRARENHQPVQSGIIRVKEVKGSETVGACVAVIRNTHTTKLWTHPEQQMIAWCFFAGFKANLLGAMLCGFFSVKRKIFSLSSAL